MMELEEAKKVLRWELFPLRISTQDRKHKLLKTLARATNSVKLVTEEMATRDKEMRGIEDLIPAVSQERCREAFLTIWQAERLRVVTLWDDPWWQTAGGIKPFSTRPSTEIYLWAPKEPQANLIRIAELVDSASEESSEIAA